MADDALLKFALNYGTIANEKETQRWMNLPSFSNGQDVIQAGLILSIAYEQDAYRRVRVLSAC